MRYLIDGYNLAHAMGLLRGRVAPTAVEVARRSLLVYLLAHGGAAGNVTVVFDAVRAPPGTPARLDYQGIRVLNALGQQADDVIEDLIEDDALPRQLAVVSDDRRLKDAARRRHCVALGCLDYLEHLQAPQPTPRNSSAENEAGDKPETISAEEAEEWYHRFGFTDDGEDGVPW